MIKEVKKPEATIVIIFGAVGDLTKRKLAPALYNLYVDDYLPEHFRFIGVSYHEHDDKSLRDTLREGADQYSRRKIEDEKWDKFSEKVEYFKADFTNVDAYKRLAKRLDEEEAEMGVNARRIFYLSVAPRFFETISINLKESGASNDAQADRVVIEKPFGRDLESAIELNQALLRHFSENQIYRIDHFLGKETVQNILAFRFANSIFEPLWNRNHIDHIQITVSETVDVGHRGGYYDNSGALRDMMQNHLMQILCMVCMEPPIDYEADDIRNRKLDVLRAVRAYESDRVIEENIIRGQYSAGMVKDKKVIGYRQAEKVADKSNTETYVSMKMLIDNWRWRGVPIYLRTGKAMPKKYSAATIVFKPVSHQLFPCELNENMEPNKLTIEMQPEPRIVLQVDTKYPGLKMKTRATDMVHEYGATYEAESPEAYETLLLDVMEGDATLFMRGDEVEEAWKIMTPILEYWEKNPSSEFPNYQAGDWGPKDADWLLERDRRKWLG